METEMKCSNRPPPFGPRTMTMAAAAAAILLALVVATAGADPGNDPRAPELEGDCEKLRVEAGHKVTAHAYAVGVQVYRWTGTGWTFVGPEAFLFHGDEPNDAFGIHYGGPT